MQRDLALDTLKVILAAFVVGIHSYFLMGTGTPAGGLLVNGLFRLAVPVFFMINGYFFCRVLEKGTLSGWLKKVLLLYIAWMLIYVPFYLPESLSLLGAFLFIKTLVLGYHHIWYLSALIFAGIMNYLLRKRSTGFLLLSSMGLFFCGVCLQYTRAYMDFPQHSLNSLLDIEWISRNFLFIAYPFMMAGILLRRISEFRRFSVVNIWILAILSLGLVLLEAGMNYAFLKGGRYSFDCLLSLGIACPLLFLGVSKFNWKHDSRRLSDLSMVIYFIHPLYISLLVDWWGLSNNGFNITLCVIALSVLTVPVHDGVKSLLSRRLQTLVPAR